MAISGAEISRYLDISSRCTVEAKKNTKLCKLHECPMVFQRILLKVDPRRYFFPSLARCRREEKLGEQRKNIKMRKERRGELVSVFSNTASIHPLPEKKTFIVSQ